MLTTAASYRNITSDLTRSLASTAAQPQVARESKAYLATIGKVTSVDAFLKNERVYRFAMKAFGLEDMTYAKAFMKKVLNEGIDKADSFANSLTDPRYREFARAFNFARDGETATQTEAAGQATVDRYVRQTLEAQAGEKNEGVRLALYFARKAPNLNSSLEILADKALLQVAYTALRLPLATSALDVDKQADLIAKRLDVADFKDPAKLAKFITRFTSLWEIDNPSSSASSSGAVVIGQPIEAGIGADLLASLQNLRLGGR